MKKLFIFFFLTLTFLCSNAQVIIKGKVIDSLTNQPITFASIGIIGTNNGTITNSEGEFIIKAVNSDIKIKIFAIGYKTTECEIHFNDKNTLRLSPTTFSLKEVLVNPVDFEKIFRKASEKLRLQNFFAYHGKAFYRLLTKNDDDHSEMIECFYDAFVGNSGIKYWEPEHGRYALNKEFQQKKYAISLDFSILTRYVDILNRQKNYKFLLFIYDKRTLDYFEISYAGNYQSEGNELIKVDFKSKLKDSVNGSVFINPKTYETYRIQIMQRQIDAEIIKSMNPSAETKNCRLEYDISFTPNQESNKMLIKNINMNIEYDVLGKQDLKILHHIKTDSKTVFYEYDNTEFDLNLIPTEKYEMDYDAINHQLYIQRFWDNNPVLAETPLETTVRKAFENNGSFGRAFNSYNDTLELFNEGYKLWSKTKKLNIKDIIHSDSLAADIKNTTFTYKGKSVAGLNGTLFFAFNCYKDTFYYSILPLFDIKHSWVDSVLRNDMADEENMMFFFQQYFDLLEAYSLKLKYEFKLQKNPCFRSDKIMESYNNIVKEFNSNSQKLLKESWGGGKELTWSRKIDEMLEQYKE